MLSKTEFPVASGGPVTGAQPVEINGEMRYPIVVSVAPGATDNQPRPPATVYGPLCPERKEPCAYCFNATTCRLLIAP